MTELVFREDSYAKECDAVVVGADERSVQLDRTVFYAAAGGQPGDSGEISVDGLKLDIEDTVYAPDGAVLHIVSGGVPSGLQPGAKAVCRIDWGRRHRIMRAHTALHVLCACVNAPVTGGSVGEARGRIDFDLDDSPDREELTTRLNEAVAAGLPVSARWVDESELDDNPELVRTMSAKPPRGTGRVRLVEIQGLDLQACGGTHVAGTAEIGPVSVAKVEKKGRQNRRIAIVLDDPS